MEERRAPPSIKTDYSTVSVSVVVLFRTHAIRTERVLHGIVVAHVDATRGMARDEIPEVKLVTSVRSASAYRLTASRPSFSHPKLMVRELVDERHRRVSPTFARHCELRDYRCPKFWIAGIIKQRPRHGVRPHTSYGHKYDTIQVI